MALTDKNGDIVANYEYDAWGKILSKSSTVNTGDGVALWKANPFRYSGYQYDDKTGLYYLKSRYYSPFLGRFITRDAVFALNLYSYAANNPTNFVDPDGFVPIDDKGNKYMHDGQIIKGQTGDGLSKVSSEKATTKEIVGGINIESQFGVAGGGKLGVQLVSDDKEEAIIGYYAGGIVGGASGSFAAVGPILTSAETVDDMVGSFKVVGNSILSFSQDVSHSRNSQGNNIYTYVPAFSLAGLKGFPFETHAMYGEAFILARWKKPDINQFWIEYYSHH
ncbi:MAG: RHS repeat-associated core domain-containing protein [Firmicutes bacterium]|nr:RHS repeat-associated core domain-containing protein [Bacillota bacterium]